MEYMKFDIPAVLALVIELSSGAQLNVPLDGSEASQLVPSVLPSVPIETGTGHEPPDPIIPLTVMAKNVLGNGLVALSLIHI